VIDLEVILGRGRDGAGAHVFPVVRIHGAASRLTIRSPRNMLSATHETGVSGDVVLLLGNMVACTPTDGAASRVVEGSQTTGVPQSLEGADGFEVLGTLGQTSSGPGCIRILVERQHFPIRVSQ